MTTELYALDYNNTQSEGTRATLMKPRVTEAEYWDKYYNAPDVTYEWNNGDLEEKAVSDFATYSMYQWFLKLIGHYLTTHPIAEITGLEMGFRLTLPGSTEIRRPDLGVVLNSNSVALSPDDRSYKGIYDICIEVISDTSKKDIKRDTVSKKWAYAKGGVKEYYILDRYEHRYMAFYHLNAQGVYIPIEPTKGGIIKSSVLPGFQFRIEDLFTKPSPDDMVDDLIYQGFVLPGYTLAKEQAKEEKRARQKAEAENAQLKALLEKLQKVR